jgi:cyclophilin family peptidyl-prolyl cis-trans isomerase
VTIDMVNRLRGKSLRYYIAGLGHFDIALDVDAAPLSAIRIARRAGEGYYDGLTFHRIAPNFVIQGGSPGANEYSGDAFFMRDEPGLHFRGTVGVSTRGHDTGDAQIFVNLIDSPRLDHIYTVFATVVSGMDVVDGILEGDVIERVELVSR